jgi:nucleoside-diphosphate-sugar epimerase
VKASAKHTDRKWDMESKDGEDVLPCVLILGGCGMVGRNLVAYLLQHNVVRKVRVADKSVPLTSYFQ